MFASKSKKHGGFYTNSTCFYHLGRILAADSFAYLKTGLETLLNDPINTIDIKNMYQFQRLYCILLQTFMLMQSNTDEKYFKVYPKEINYKCHLKKILIMASSFQKCLKH